MTSAGVFYPSAIRVWLMIGVIMIAVQIIVGGITRLTGSGLSITRWEIVTGTLPPQNAEAWDEAFELYKQTPQYRKINRGMSLSEFKWIYFWEYFHRLWARLFGIVFLVPFIFFLIKGWIDRPLMKRLVFLFGFGALVATFGWIMVASGLVERPWVDAYKLTIHLNLGLFLFAATLWTALYVQDPVRGQIVRNSGVRNILRVFIGLLIVQLLLGGVMSGMKAGLFYPTWPDMNGTFIPSVVLKGSLWTVDSFEHYDTQPLAPAVVQFMHRMFAYLLLVVGGWLVWKVLRGVTHRTFRIKTLVFAGALVVQVVLGILTVINSIGYIPLALGVLHQAGAVLLIATCVLLLYQSCRD